MEHWKSEKDAAILLSALIPAVVVEFSKDAGNVVVTGTVNQARNASKLYCTSH